MSHIRHRRNLFERWPARMVACAASLVVVASSIHPLAVAPSAAVPAGPTLVRSAPVQGFQSGNIIDDAVFFASGTMLPAGIQSFLNARVATCQSGYVCLKDFSQATNSRPADAMCTQAYTGRASETAAQIIYNVGQACGINPQVLLVMLQKEQGLVTHTWPSDWRYTMAMGQGCPDTAACDARYRGFFNQVYGAAWQMKRYANPVGTSQFFTWYAPGKTWNVRYSPDVNCGSSPVFIRNQATANLYYYTPYQPNDAALAAGQGEGDGCSAYGNRNFFSYFSMWFGPTQSAGSSAIAAAHASLGGAAGRLGEATTVVSCRLVGAGCYQDFRNGKIHWSASTGAHATQGGILMKWSDSGSEEGKLGYPTSGENCGLPAAGCYQHFVGGMIYWSPSSGAQAVRGGMLDGWKATGSERGRLGYPIGDESCGLVGGGCFQQFQNGRMHWSNPVGAHSTSGSIADAWGRLGFENGKLGYTSSEESCGLPSSGCYQHFQGGIIYWTASTGAHAVQGAILDFWKKQGSERGALGYPLAGEGCGLPGGGCYQEFQGGVVHWSPVAGTQSTRGEIRTAWIASGSERGELGYPVGPQGCGLPAGGCYQQFERGMIHASPAGAFATTGDILTTWAAQGYEQGKLGYPVAAQVCSEGKCSQKFQGGTIS